MYAAGKIHNGSSQLRGHPKSDRAPTQIPGQQLHLKVDPIKCHLFDHQGNAMRRLKAEV